MTKVEPDVISSPESPAMPAARSATLAERYEATRALTERLASPLTPEDQTVQSMPDVSPTKWHRAHTSWFFETFLLGPHLDRYRQFHPQYGYLFNSYYEAVGPRHPRAERGLVTRPGVEEVASYRRHVDESMATLLSGAAPAGRVADLVELGIQHEQQHQELLLMDIKHVLSQSPLYPAYQPAAPVPAGTDARDEGPVGSGPGWIAHEEGLADVGAPGDGFCFDNELPRHRAQLVPFALADRPVTCGEWLAFMDDGGYERPELWLSEGWATVAAQRWRAPLYWDDDDGDGWQVFTLGGRRPVGLDEPVCHVSYFEADAFAHWTGFRLPTEAEWETAAGPSMPPTAGLSVDRLHPTAPEPARRGGVTGVGQVWEWTASPYTPYPGFRAAPGAVGEYNGKFMVNQQVLRGGSCVTPPGHARATYRNFFPPSARWAFNGLRLARDL